jgi:O-antigen/teichoic acid export membrane protein
MLRAALRDTLIYGIASVLTKGLAIILLPLYTRVMSPADYGVYDLLITLGALANLVVALEVSQGMARHWADAETLPEKVGFASTSLAFTLLMYALFLAGGLIWALPLTQLLLGSDELLVAFRLGVAFITANGIYYLLLNQFRWELRSKAYAVVSVLYAALTLGFAALLCLGLGLGLEGVMLAQLGAALCALLCSAWLLRGSFRPLFELDKLLTMLRFSAPLVPAGLAIFISLYINRFALNHYASLVEVGLFGLGSRIAGLAVLLILGVQAALTPPIYQHYRAPETPARIARLFGWFMAVALSGCLFLALFARELLMLFATPDYIGAAGLVVFLGPALLLSQMYIFAPGIAIRKKTYLQLWVTLLAALISIISNWLLVPRWGVYGAALATLASSATFFLAWVVVSQRLYPIPYARSAVGLAVVVYMAAAASGIWLDAQGLGLPLLLAAKCGLLVLLLLTVVAVRLLPLSDILSLIKLKRSAI